jgi:choice-of-anchor B domain-containing protein
MKSISLRSLLTGILIFAFGIISAQAPNYNMTLSGQLAYPGQALSNIWHYVGSNGNEYALVGAQNGLSIVNVTNPANPVQITQVPGPSCSWREVKTWGNYAYVTTECGSIGLQIIDLTNLPNPSVPVYTWTPTIMSTQLQTIHALHADNGKLYLYGSNIGNGGVIIASVATTPTNPQYLGIYNTNYVHDGYVRNDTLYGGHIYAGYFSVMNLTNPASPQVLQTQNTPSNFTHNTWLPTFNSKFLFTTDEVNNSYLASYDIQNLGNIQELDRIQSQNAGGGSVVHNTHIINVGGNDFAVTSWYKDGVVITDVGRPNNMVNVAWYDTYTQGQGGGFSGCWGVNPYLPSGKIIASDINNGLFVLNPTYTRACYLEGTITDFSTGLPINGASVQILTTPGNASSAPNGFYGTGNAVAGTYSVQYSKPGYFSQTISVTLNNGVVTTQNVALVPIATIPITGQVIQLWNGAGIPNARVKVWNATFRFDTITDANGNFTFPSGYPGTYEIMAGKWTYWTQCAGNVNISSTSGPLVIALDSGYYDDFTLNYNWTISSTATDGFWERGEPRGTSNGNSQANPEYDVNNDCFENAFVTGNQGNSAGDDDVDGGHTTLISPVMNLTGYPNPYLRYSRWFYNGGGSGMPNDTLKISISNGTTTVAVDVVTAISGPQSTWIQRAYKISQYIPITSTMQVRVRAVDASPGHIVEGGFDYFRITDSSITTSFVHDVKTIENQIVVYPNPLSENSKIMYALTELPGGWGSIELVGLSGQIIQSSRINAKVGDFQVQPGIPQGIYFVVAKGSDGNLLGTPFKIVKTR